MNTETRPTKEHPLQTDKPAREGMLAFTPTFNLLYYEYDMRVRNGMARPHAEAGTLPACPNVGTEER